MPTRISRRTGVSIATSCICVLALASCGTDRGASAQRDSGPVRHTSSQAISAHYTLPEGEIGLPRVRVTTAGPDLIRFEWDILEDVPPTHWLVIYDGDRLFAHLSDFKDPYQVYDSPDDFGGEFYDFVRSWVLLPGSARMAEACPDAERLGTRSILGRTAVGYRCGRSHAEMVTARRMWVDRTTGLVLRAGRLVADQVDPHPQIDASTFSTTQPEGVEVRHFPAR